MFSRDNVIRAVVSKTNPIGDPATGLTRTAALSDIQGFSADYPFMVDLDFWLQVLEKGDMLHTPAVLSYFRISGGALSGSRFFQNCGDYVRFYRRRIKPHFNDRLMLYYWGYLCFAGPGAYAASGLFHQPMKKNIGHQMRRFLLVGGVNTAVSYGLYVFLFGLDVIMRWPLFLVIALASFLIISPSAGAFWQPQRRPLLPIYFRLCGKLLRFPSFYLVFCAYRL